MVNSRLSWFPVLFFTTVWVSEIYTTSQPDLDPSDPIVAAAAVRSGARALFFQALVNLVVSFGLPFFISESGLQPTSTGHDYSNLNGGRHGNEDIPSSALRKRGMGDNTESGWGAAVKRILATIIEGLKGGSASWLPIRGLTLLKVWYSSNFLFAATMGASW
jgi:solute carrier family 45 protein 1/2/4